MRKKPLHNIKIRGLDNKGERLLRMYLHELGCLDPDDECVMKAILKPDLKKITTFVKLLGGEVEVLEMWYVETF